jgi:hypothetical protein
VDIAPSCSVHSVHTVHLVHADGTAKPFEEIGTSSRRPLASAPTHGSVAARRRSPTEADASAAWETVFHAPRGLQRHRGRIRNDPSVVLQGRVRRRVLRKQPTGAAVALAASCDTSTPPSALLPSPDRSGSPPRVRMRVRSSFPREPRPLSLHNTPYSSWSATANRSPWFASRCLAGRPASMYHKML